MAQAGTSSTILSKFEISADKLDSWFSKFYPALILVFCFLNIKFLSYLVPDPDLFARLAVGKLIVQSGTVPLQDPFSFSPTKSIWMDHEWLSGVVFYQIYRGSGEIGLLFFKYLVAVATVAFLFRTQILLGSQKGRVSWVWALFTLIPCSYLWLSTVRCQVFTYLFISIIFYLLVSAEKNKRHTQLWFLSPLFLAWTQLHGGFVLGLLTLCLWILWSIYRRSFTWMLGLVLIFSIAATFISPYGGVAFWQNIIQALSMPRPNIDEWGAIPVLSFEGAAAIAVLLAFLIYRRFDLRGFSFVLIGFALGFVHYRLIALFYFFALIFGGESKFKDSPKMLQRTTAVVGILAIVFSLTITISTVIKNNLRFDYSGYPVAAFNWLKANKKSGRLLVDFTLGSYALWQLHPNFLVSVDGRYEEVYEEETVQNAMVALDLNSPTQLYAFKSLDPDFVLIRTEMNSSWKTSEAINGWNIPYSDPTYSLWIKGKRED